MWEKRNLKPIVALSAIFAVSLGGYMIVAGYGGGELFPQLRKYERNAETYIKQGGAKFNEGDYHGAITDYDLAIELDPDRADAYYDRGRTKYRLNDYYGAMADSSRAIELDPDYAKAYNYQGIAEHNLGDYDDAIAHYDRAVKLNPNHAKAYFLRGFAKWFLRDPDGAKADYDRCIELNPNYEEAYFLRGLAKREFGDLPGAIADYDRAIENFERLLHLERRLLLRRGGAKEDYDRAIEQQRFLFLYHGVIADYDWSIEFKPNYVATVAAYINRGKAKWGQGDYRGAIADYSRMMTVWPQGVTAKFLRPFWVE